MFRLFRLTAIGLVALVACGADAIKAPPAPASQPAVTVTIDNFTYSPATLTVPRGTTVTWINHDDIPHTATSDHKVFASDALDTDESFSFQFKTPGTYPYHCALHPHMTAKVIVK